VAALKVRNPSLKIMFSTGTAAALHQIVQSPASIATYADSVLQLARRYNLDGVDFDWEYPCGGDALKFTQLLQAFRSRIDSSRLPVLLSAAIGAGLNTLADCFDLAGLTANLDFINVMCYDYNTIYNTRTAYASPLFARPDETGYDATLNANSTINYLISRGVPRAKLVLGLNAGGHTFQLAEPWRNGFHAPVKGVGYGSGWSTYPELCQLVSNGGRAVYDDVAQVMYAVYEDQWTNTGDVRSARVKAEWARGMGLAGVFTFCLNWDDLSGACGWNVTFPIHRAVREGLLGVRKGVVEGEQLVPEGVVVGDGLLIG